MKHFYKTSFSNRHKGYKILCKPSITTPLSELDEDPSSVPTHVTCPKCLEILIPKEKVKLDKMLLALEKSKEILP